MSQDRKPMTAQGKKRVEITLKQLIQEERPKIIEAIKVARAHGDLSENADYDAAKEQQGILESRIAELTEQLVKAQVVDVLAIKSDTITFGASVELKNLDDDKRFSYSIVGEAESNARQGLISVSSPLAKKMIGLRKGDTFTLHTPNGDRDYEVLKFVFK